MENIISSSMYFGVVLTVATYFFGVWLSKITKIEALSPLITSTVIIIIVLVTCKIDYDTFTYSAKYINWFLTPTTICLAIPLYEQLEKLKQNYKAIFIGIFAGVITSLCTVFLLSKAFGLSHEIYISLLPKSVTTAIGLGISEELHGNVTITMFAISLTGPIAHAFGTTICKIFKIVEPVAVGLSFGTSAHGTGTAKAMELGEVQGAMGSLSICIAGLMTLIFANFFTGLI